MNMAIMDVATLEPLAEALPRLLNKNGVYVVVSGLIQGNPLMYPEQIRCDGPSPRLFYLECRTQD